MDEKFKLFCKRCKKFTKHKHYMTCDKPMLVHYKLEVFECTICNRTYLKNRVFIE